MTFSLTSTEGVDVELQAGVNWFGPDGKPPKPIEWLTDNGSCYTAAETRSFASKAIGAQAGEHASDQPTKQRHGRDESCENIETGLRQTRRSTRLANGDGTAAQMVR